MNTLLRRLADCLVLGSCLDLLRAEFGGYELVEHWQQGEFHHDVVLRVRAGSRLPGDILVVATNCNGGIKEVVCFSEVPNRLGLWRLRCPENAEFAGPVPTMLMRETTEHWFDPCELLGSNARSELRPEFRQRQMGGGWERNQ